MTKQYAPNHLVYIGIVTRVHVNQGSIEVAIQNGYELNELHDVSAQTPTNRDGLFFNSTSGLWESRAIASTDLPKSIRPSVRFLTPTLSGNSVNEQVIATISIPANTLVVNDIIKIGAVWSFSLNGGTKTPRIRLGNNTIVGNTLYSPSSISASVNSVQMEVLAIITSSTNLKLFPSATTSGYGTGTGAVTNNTISLSNAIDFSINILKATAGDTASLEFAYIEILTS
jgi:hypothetical protein